MRSKYLGFLSKTGSRYLAILNSVLLVVQIMAVPVSGAVVSNRSLNGTSYVNALSGLQNPILKTSAIDNANVMKISETQAGKPMLTDVTTEGSSIEVPSAGDLKKESVTVMAAAYPSQTEQNITNEIIVKYRTASTKTLKSGAGELSAMQAQSVDGAGTTLIKVNSGEDINAKLNEIKNDPQVEYAEPNYRLYAAETPNDPRYSEQWALKDNAYLYAPQAWSSALGVSGSVHNAAPVLMAVLDTGIDYNHEDLTERVELYGFNAINGETVPGSIMDDSISGHGTLVAGIAAAATNNGIGISGTAGEFPVKILPVKVLDKFGTGTMLSVAQGIRWAANNGARVINLSLGARLPDYPNTLAEAVKYAQDKGILVVAAGGNDGGNVEGFYPACLPGVISVGSTDNQNKETDFTTDDCSVYAPGVSILSTLPSSAQYPGEPVKYGAITGSSASAPMASAACALLWSVYPLKSADTIADSVRDGYKYYGYPNYSYVLSLLNSLNNATKGYQNYNNILFVSPDNLTNIAGTIELAVQVENPDETEKVDFYYGTSRYDETSYTLIGSVVNDGTRQSGIYSIQFNTTPLNDGMYYIKAVGTYTGNQYMTVDKEITVYNQQKSGLSIKVLKPDKTNGVGAKVTVWHIMKNGTDVIYEPIAYDSFTADSSGGLIIPGGASSQYTYNGFAADGNDYLITARGTDPNYLYYKTVRAPAKVVMDSTDAKKVFISGKSLEGNPLAGAVIMTDAQDIDISRFIYYGSEYNEITHVPVATLNTEGNAEVYLTYGKYDFKLLDAGNKYLLVKDDITVSDAEANISFIPKQNEVSMLKLAPDPSDNVKMGAILLKNRLDEELVGFELSDMNEKIVISPGSYSACISALYADGVTQDKYWKYELEVPYFDVAAGNTHGISFGGTFNGTTSRIKISSIGPNVIFHPDGIIRTGQDAWFSATIIDAKGNRVIGLYNVTEPVIKPVSQSSILKKAAGDNTYDKEEPSQALKNRYPTYSYNWKTAGFEAVSALNVYPNITISDISDTVLKSQNMIYSVDSWTTSWYVPSSSSDVQYKAWVNVDAGVLGAAESEKYIFTAKTPSSIPAKEPDLKVTVNDREGNPMQEGNILLLHKEGNLYKRVNTSDYGITYGIKSLSQGMCSYYNTELIPGDEYALALYGKSKVPGVMSDALEPLFLYETFTAVSGPMEIKINSYDYNLKKVNLKPKDQENVSFYTSQYRRKLEYWAYAITSGELAVGMFLASDNTANDLSLWLPSLNEGNPAKYMFQVTASDWEDAGKPLYLMNKALSVPSDVSEAGLDVILGGSDLANISFGESFSNYNLGGVALFDNVIGEAVVLHPYYLSYASGIESANNMNELFVSSGSYTANAAVGQKGINGRWGYWLERNISLLPGAKFVWNSSDQFTVKLETYLSEYRPGDTAVFTNTIEDSYGSRLNAACTGIDFSSGGMGPMQIDLQNDISAQNHYEIAPFITVLDPTGNEVLRYKQPSDSSLNFYLWNSGNYNDKDIPILITRADSNNTYFKGSYTVPQSAGGGNYSAWLEFGAGPNGIIKSPTINFKVLADAVPFINLDQPASPVKNQTVSISGTANPGSLVEILYNYGAIQNISAGTAKAGLDGKFIFENIPLQDEGEYIFKGVIKKDNVIVKESITVTIRIDRTAPGIPGNFKAEGQNETTIALTWEEASDNDLISGYRIVRDGVTLETLDKGVLLYTDSSLQKDIDYHYEIYSFDRAGNESLKAAATGRTLNTGDTKAPTVPTNLTIGIVGGIVTLGWNASSDNIRVAGYRVLRSSGSSEPNVIGNTDAATLTFTDSGLFAETTYTYYVKAYDEKGNESGLSEAKMIVTPEINLNGISWRLPRKTVNGLAFSNDTVSLTISGDKNRDAEAVVNYMSWYDDKGTLLGQPNSYEQRVPMAEDAAVKGLYRGSYAIKPGVSQIVSITGVLSDGGGHKAERQSDRLPIGVAGGVTVKLTLPAGANITPEEAKSFLMGSGLVMVGYNKTSFASVNINNGLASYFMEGLAPADDYVLTQRNGYGSKMSEAEGISVKNGITTTFEFVPTLPATLNVRVLDEADQSPVKGVRVYCLKLPDYIFLSDGTSGNDGWAKNAATSVMPFAQGMKSGDEVKFNVSINEDLYSKYDVSSLPNYQLVLNAGENSYDIHLKRHNFTTLQGTVTDTGNAPVEGVLVTAIQRMNGRYYNLEYTAITDSNGHYSMQVLPQEATVIFTHRQAETMTKYIQQINGPVNAQLNFLGLIRLNVFTKMAGDTQERPLEIDWRVGVHFNLRIVNKNSGRYTTQSGTDWPYVKVDGAPGDTITISLSGREAGMSDSTVEVTLNKNMYAEADVHLVENGKIALRLLDQFGNSLNGYTRTMEVYKADEPNARKFSASSAVNSHFEEKLPDGLYTLVFYWGPDRNYAYNSTWNGYWNINNWSYLYQEGVDFVKVNNVEVRQGEITDIGDVFLDKSFSLSEGYFAGKEGNSFTPNNTEAVPGNTVTLTAIYNYDETQSVHPANVKLKLAIPDNSQLIENSIGINVQKGNENPQVTINQGYIEMDLGDAAILENGVNVIKGLKGTVTYQVKLNQNPDSSRCGTRAWMEFFGQKGNTVEELGSAIIKMPFVTISAPTEVGSDNTDRAIKVYGRAPAGTTVSIYDGYNLVSEALSTEFGVWRADITLIDRGKPSAHFLSAKIMSEGGKEITSKVIKVTYGTQTPILTGITMYQQDGRHVTFDPGQGVASFPYVYVPNMPFTFEADFTNNAAVENVRIIARNGVYTHILNASYDTEKDCFIAEGNLTNGYNADPGTIFVEYTIKEQGYIPPKALPNEQQEREAMPEAWRDAEYSFNEGTPNPNTQFDNNGLLRIPPVTVTLKDVSRYMSSSENAANAGIFTQSSVAGSNDITLKVLMEVQYLEDLSSTNVFGTIPLYGGMSVYNTEMSMSGDTYTLSFIAPMKALCADSAAEQLIRSLGVNINIDTGYGKVTVNTTQIGGAYKLFDTVKSGFDFKEKLEDLNTFLEGAVGCSSNARGYYEQRAQDLADSAFTNLCVKYATTLAGIGFASTGVGIVGTVAISAVGGIGNFVAERRWQDSFKNLKAELANDDDCKDDEDEDDDDDNDEDDDNDDDDRDDNGNRKKRKKAAKPKYIWDPSGYVYEVIPENRLQGVTATAMYKDANGDWKVWDAVWYLQENPLVTDNEGRYAWDVPQGEWKVAYEKQGYETAYSDVLTVPPPQTEVNIGMISTKAPEVVSIMASGGKYIEITFSKFMKVSTLTLNSISVTPSEGGADALDGNFVPIAPVTDENGIILAKTVRFTPTTPMIVDHSYKVFVNKLIQCYAGFFMEMDAEKTVIVIPATIQVANISLDRNSLTINEGGTFKLTASITPSDATDTRVIWSSDKPWVAEVDENGRITGKASGTALITVTTVDGNKTASCSVTVKKKKVSGNNYIPSVPVIIPATGLELDKTHLTLNENGDPFLLTVKILPANSTETEVIWTSSDKSVATVNNGLVTPLKPGEAEISVSLKNGSISIVCKVTVKAGNVLNTVIGKEAQYVKAFNDEVVLYLEEDTFPEGTTLTITKLEEDKQEEKPGSARFTFKGASYEIDANGAEPKKPVHIIVKYDTQALNGIDPMKLGIFMQEDNKSSLWVYKGGAVNIKEGTIETWVLSFGKFALMASEKTFEDIKTHWSRNFIEVLASRNIINGINDIEFQPERPITRAEMAKMLIAVLMSDARNNIRLISPETQTFEDVKAGEWYYNYVETAAFYGLVKGDNGRFRPDDLITREEMALMIIRILYTEEELNKVSGSNLNLNDVNDLSAWAKEAVMLANQKGLVLGDGEGNFRPKEPALRGQVAAVLLRTMEQLGLLTKLVEIKGKVALSEEEGRHFELNTCPKCNLPPVYVLLPMDDIVAAKLETAIGKKVEVKAILLEGPDTYMKGPVIKVVSIDILP